MIGSSPIVSMSFDTPAIRVLPQPDGSVVVEAEGEGSEVAEEKARPRRPNPTPPWLARIIAMSEGEEVVEVTRESGEIDVEQLAAELGTDELRLFADKGSLSPEELEPLIEVAREHKVEIDVHLLQDG
jgi:hypothetical protein